MEVHHKTRFKPRVLYLTQYLIDRFLSVNSVARTQLQLLSVTCLFVALKCEDNVIIPAKDLATIADGAFKAEEMV